MNFGIQTVGKVYDPLREEMVFNGPEMKWIGTAISAAVGIASGIASGNSAQAEQDAQNKAIERQYEYDVDLWEYKWDEANRDYEHVTAGVQITRDNHERDQAFKDQLSIRKYQQESQTQMFDYMNQSRQFQQSEKNYRNQLNFNNMAAAVAYEDEARRYDDIKIDQAFKRQDLMVQGMQERGEAALTQAGRSAGKAMQSAVAALGRNSAILDESLRSAYKQHSVNLEKISTDKYGADLSAHAQKMLMPLMPPPIMKPLANPRAVFQDPRAPEKPPKPIKGAKASGAGWSAASSILGGIAGAASGLSGISSGDIF